MNKEPITLAITGGFGNIGKKLMQAFEDEPWCGRILAVDRQLPTDFTPPAKTTAIVGDFADKHDPNWRDAIALADAIIHLAAQNPYPDASWTDSARSVDMTAHVVQAAGTGKPRRLVFASSNHVMGRWKDEPEALIPGSLSPETPPFPGTRWQADGKIILDAAAYSVAKLMGERICVAQAEEGGLTAVALRIGWCQPGENHPSTITAAGTPKETRAATDSQTIRDLAWFRRMWLSNRDMIGVMRAAVLADAAAWPAPGIVVNAMSANADAPWNLGPTLALLGYQPVDDAYRVLGAAA